MSRHVSALWNRSQIVKDLSKLWFFYAELQPKNNGLLHKLANKAKYFSFTQMTILHKKYVFYI